MLGINESFATNSTVPQLVPDLADQEIIEIDVGAEHVAALSSKSQVFSWGMNNEGQVSLRSWAIFLKMLLKYDVLFS